MLGGLESPISLWAKVIESTFDGEQEEVPELPEEHPTAVKVKAYKEWNQGTRKVMH